MPFLELPSSEGYTLRRRDYEDALLHALSDTSTGGEHPLIITNPSNSADLATGKTLLVLTVLRSLLRDGHIKHVLWIGLGQYHNGIPPYREMLIELANKLREIFSKQLGTSCSISQLYGASIEECQEYVGLLMSHIRSHSTNIQSNSDMCGADEVILVLDELTRARHASMFAQLGLRTIITTRFVTAAQYLIDHEHANTTAAIFQVGGLTPQQAQLLLTKASNLKAVPTSKTLRSMERLSGSLRCFHMIASLLSDESSNEALLQKLQESKDALLQSCLHLHLKSMLALERASFIKLLMLPHMGPVVVELACRLWKQSHNMGLARLESFSKQGLIVFSENKASFHVPYDVVEATAALTMKGTSHASFAEVGKPSARPFADDLTLPDRIEAAHAVLLYVTDLNLIRHPDFNSLYKSSFVACWEHLLQLHPVTALGNLVERTSPKQAYERLVFNMKRSGQDGNSRLALARILEVVLSVRPECFACHRDDGSHPAIKLWLTEEIFQFLAAYQDLDKAGVELLSYSSVFRSFGAYLIEHDAEKATTCVEFFLELFCAASETAAVDEAAERNNLLQISDAFVFLTRCQMKSGSTKGAQASMQAAAESFKDALPNLPASGTGSFTHPDAVALSLLDTKVLNAAGLYKEAHNALITAITECERSSSRVSREVLSCYCSRLGDVLYEQQLFNKARKAYAECMAMRLDLYGELHPATLDAMELFGKCCVSSKKHGKAVQMLHRAIDARTVMYGFDHPALQAIASAAHESLKILDPENPSAITQFLRPLLRDVVSAEKTANKYTQPMGYVHHGDERFVAARVLQLMSESSMISDNEREAKAYSKKALDVLMVNRGNIVVPLYEYGVSSARNQMIGDAYRHLGSVYQRRDRPHKAADSFQMALVHFINCCADDSVIVPLVTELTSSLMALGFRDDAEAFSFLVTDILKCAGTSVSNPAAKPKVAPSGHLSTIKTLQTLSGSLHDQCKHIEAKRVLLITQEGDGEDAEEGKEAVDQDKGAAEEVSGNMAAQEDSIFESVEEAKDGAAPSDERQSGEETAAEEAAETHAAHVKAVADVKAAQNKVVADAMAEFTVLAKTEDEVAAEIQAAAEKAAAEAKAVADAQAIADALAAAEAKAIADAQAIADALAAAEAKAIADAQEIADVLAAAEAQAALEKATEEKRIADAVAVLAKAAEDVNKREHLIAACLNNDMSDVTGFLQEGIDVNTQCEDDGSTLLLMACIAQHVKMARLLLSFGADSRIADKDGNSPLLVTCLNGTDEIYDMIMNSGDQSPEFLAQLLTHMDADGQGPLLVAARNGRLNFVSDILQRQVNNLNDTDKNGNTPLIAAVLGCHAPVVDLLLAAQGVDHSQPNKHGDTPLLLAALRKSVSIARSLLLAGANKREENADGMTPIDVAVWNNDEELFSALMHDDHLATSIQSAWRMYRVRKAIGHTVDAHIVQARHDKWTALHNMKIVKAQTQIRMFIAKREMKKRLLDSVFERVKGYAIMKIAFLVRHLFRKYVINFRVRKEKGENKSEVPKNTAEAVSPAGETQMTESVAERDDCVKNQTEEMCTPARSQSRSQEQRDTAATDSEGIEQVDLTPRQKRFAASGLFRASAVLATKAQGMEVKRKIRVDAPIIELDLATMLQRGSSWKEMSKFLAENPQAAQLLTTSAEYPLQQALRLKASSEVILGLLNYFPAAASAVNLMGNTALHSLLNNLVVDDKKNLFFEILSAHPDSARIVNKEGDLPLHLAARSIEQIHDERDVTEYIINALVEANPVAAKQSNFAGNLPLHIALQKHVSRSVISALLDAFPEGVHTVAHDGKYPMRVAFQNDCSLDVVRKIMDVSGHNVSVAEGHGSALHVAMKYKAPEDVLLDIIERFPDSLRQTDDNAYLPLHLALKMFNATPSITTEVVKSLIRHNEDAGGIPLLGVYPLQFAMSKNMDVEIVTALSESYPFNDKVKATAEAMIQLLSSTKSAAASVEIRMPTHEALLAQLDAVQPISSDSFLNAKQFREALAKDQARLRDERLATAAREREVRDVDAALRRENAAKERAALVEQSRMQRLASMLVMQKQEEEEDAKRQAYLKTVEDMVTSPVSVEASSNATIAESSNSNDPIVSQKLIRWKKAGQRVVSEKEKVVVADTKEEPAVPIGLQPWKRASTYAIPVTPPKTTKERSKLTPNSAVPFNKKVELSPSASSRALHALLRAKNEDSDSDEMESRQRF